MMSSSSSFLLLHSFRRAAHPANRFIRPGCNKFSSHHTGKVIFYMRNKAYGFIKPNNNGSDVFVHRSGIQCLVPAELNPSNPFLKAGECVRYELEGERAVNVVFEDGREIPMYRDKNLESQIKAAHYDLGRSMYAILANAGGTVEMNANEIQQAYDKAKGRIAEIEKWMKEGKTKEENEAMEENNVVDSDAAPQEEDSKEKVIDHQIEEPEQSTMEEQPEKP